MGYSLGSIPRKLKSRLLSGKRITKKYMKYDIVVKKRESILKQLEQKTRICFHLNKIHIPEDSNKQILKRTLNSLDSSILLEFDSELHADFEDPNFIDKYYKDMTYRTVLLLEEDVRKLRYEYIKLRAKEAKLAGPIHLYEYNKKGLWFKLRKLLLWVSLVLIVFLSALSLHSQISYTLNVFFDFNFDVILRNILGAKVVFVVQSFLLFYISVAVIYANCRIELRHWYLLEKKSSSLNSLLFYIL